jgi:hypothetical protein
MQGNGKTTHLIKCEDPDALARFMAAVDQMPVGDGIEMVMGYTPTVENKSTTAFAINQAENHHLRQYITRLEACMDVLVEILEDPTHDWNNVKEAIEALQEVRNEESR